MSILTRYPRVVFHVSLLVALLALGIISTLSFHQYAFGGDGFNYYAALRNFLDGMGMWEGPTYEYLLGNHSYLTLFILLPFVWIFRSAIVFLYASHACWYIASVLFFEVCLHLVGKRQKGTEWIACLLGFLYFTYPVALHLAAPTFYLFQPDFLVAPAIMVMFLGLLKQNRTIFYCSIAFILATKEEFIVLFPVILGWMVGITRLAFGSVWLKKRDYVHISIIYVLVSILCVSVLYHYRALNVINIAVRQPDLGALLQWWAIKYAAEGIAALLFTLVPLMALILWKGSPSCRWILLATLIVFVFGRDIVNIIVYTRAVPRFFHSRIILVPTLMISLAVALATFRPRWENLKIKVAGCILSGIVLNFVGICTLFVDPAMLANDILRHPETWQKLKAQVDEIAPFIKPPIKKGETLLLNPTFASTFAAERNYVYMWEVLFHRDIVVPYIEMGIIDKKHLLPTYFHNINELLPTFWKDFEKIHETDDFIVVKKRSAASTSE